MIRMFYYDVDEFTEHVINRDFFMYDEKTFEHLVNWQEDEDGNSIMPFRDEFSKKFLKDTWNIEFVSEDDWYSIQSPEEGRFCLSGLSKEMKYALTLLHFSRNERIMSFWVCSREIWKTLSDMPFDILVAVDTSKLDSWSDVDIGVDYIIEHFPFNNEYVQVNVVDGLTFDKEKVTDMYGVSLSMKNGKYYGDSFDVNDCFMYYFWKKHIPDLITYAKHSIKEEHPIVNKTMTCSLDEYTKLLNLYEDYFCSINKYADRVSDIEDALQEGVISQEVFEKEISESKITYASEYEKYLWLKNSLKIRSHLYTLPDDRIFRKLPVMIIDKYSDGSYKIWGTLTVKYPRFEEILYDVIHDHYTDECERYITVVDIEELFRSASDIKYTNCGFKITENCIDVFDKNDALKLFVEMAQEALDSGNCSISDEFY